MQGAAEAVQELSRRIGAVGLTWLTGPHTWPGMPLSGKSLCSWSFCRFESEHPG